MKRLKTSEVGISTEFIKKLGAQPDIIKDEGTFPTYHRITFITEKGTFFAFWDDSDNTIRITCEGRPGANHNKLLNGLKRKVRGIAFPDGVVCRSRVLRGDENELSVLAISFFTK